MSGILIGMRVFEGSTFVAVPLAGMTLAQMGAEVIRFDRIECGFDANPWPVDPSGASHFWAELNKCKKLVAVNMKAPEGRNLITHIISRHITALGDDTGLFITNLCVRSLMDHDTLSQFRNDLISVTLSGDRHGRPAVGYTVNPALCIPEITAGQGDTTSPRSSRPGLPCTGSANLPSTLMRPVSPGPCFGACQTRSPRPPISAPTIQCSNWSINTGLADTRSPRPNGFRKSRATGSYPGPDPGAWRAHRRGAGRGGWNVRWRDRAAL